GHANLFLSPLFRQIFADVTQCELHLVDSSSSQGAAIGAAIGGGKLKLADLNTSIKTISTTKPDSKRTVWYQELYLGWKNKIELG
ncbi:MAG TPA: carbohydrate kinase, partial [Catalimonadaceae bacterium]|nr:carbohydrate kinase [Catalimonadaceae bacterium]